MGFNRPVNTNEDREISVANNEQAYYNFQSAGNDGPANLRYAQELSASVKSDAEVTFWFEWGRWNDEFDALPHKGAVSTCAAASCKSLISKVAGAPGKARLVIDNQSGGTATITRDIGVFG